MCCSANDCRSEMLRALFGSKGLCESPSKVVTGSNLPKLLLRLLTSKLSQLLTSKLSQDSGADNSGADVSDAGVSDADDSDADDSDTNTLSPDTLEPDDEAGGGCTGQTCRPQLDHIIVLSKKLLYFCKTAVLLASYN